MPVLPQDINVTRVQGRQDPGYSVATPGPSGLVELGKTISQVTKDFQDANDSRVLSNLETQTAAELEGFQAQLEENPDSFEEWEAKVDEFAKNQRESVQSKGINRRVYDAWSRSHTPLQERAKLKARVKSREILVNKGVTDLASNLEAIQGLAITSTISERDQYTAQADLLVERAQDKGFIKDSTAKDMRDKFRAGTEKARFERALMVDPELAKEALDAGDFNVSEAERPAWEKTVNSAIKTKKEQERIDEGRRIKQEEDALKAKKEETELSFIDRIDSDNPPTLEEINRSPLDANHKLQWRKVISEEPTLNREIYADLTTAINGDTSYKGAPVTRETITGLYREGNLTKDAHNYLIGRWDKIHAPATEKDAAKENDVKLAVGVLNGQYKNDKFDADDPTKNSIAYARAVDDLVKWSAANPDKNPIDYAEQVLVPQVEKSFWSKTADKIGALFVGESQDNTARNAAIKYLNDKNYPATEQNITRTMDFLNAAK